VREPRLTPHYELVQQPSKQFERIPLFHLPRSANLLVDALERLGSVFSFPLYRSMSRFWSALTLDFHFEAPSPSPGCETWAAVAPLSRSYSWREWESLKAERERERNKVTLPIGYGMKNAYFCQDSSRVSPRLVKKGTQIWRSLVDPLENRRLG